MVGRDKPGHDGLWMCLLVLGVLTCGPAAAQTAPDTPLRRTTITVNDHLGFGQREETIAVFFAGVLAGTLHVDAAHPNDSFTATVPLRPRLGFSLCGKLLRDGSDGSDPNHPIDNGGVLEDYDGASFAALTLGDVLFTLSDESGRAQATVQQGPACNAAVS